MSEPFREITVDELESLVAGGARLVDVREPDEYAAGHVPGARLVPLGEVPARVADCVEGGGTTYLICRSGGRSATACQHLAGLGLDVVNVAGGTMAWIMSGRPVVEGDSPT
ncbi:MAG: rhodanese-like domain-containing protein [Ilumatobacteraceae bacterium]